MNVQNGLLDHGDHARQAVMMELRQGTLEYDTIFLSNVTSIGSLKRNRKSNLDVIFILALVALVQY